MSKAVVKILRAVVGAHFEIADLRNLFFQCCEFTHDTVDLYLGRILLESETNDMAQFALWFAIVRFGGLTH